MRNSAGSSNTGLVVAVRGNIVDVRFENNLPPIHSLLYAGAKKEVAIEVLSQLDTHRVRAMALTPTRGLGRNITVEASGTTLTVPVGDKILSRMFDVFGNTIDGLEALENLERRSIHKNPPALSRRSVKSELFETGIKIIDVLMPLERINVTGLEPH